MAKYDHGGGCACGLYKECCCERRSLMSDLKEKPDHWTQKAITQWSRQTFGIVSPTVMAVRMNKEVAELLIALGEGDVEEARKETADVGVMILQVAELLGFDLTFGPAPSPNDLAVRLDIAQLEALEMNRNVAELITVLTLADLTQARRHTRIIWVRLGIIANTLNIDLRAGITAKMDINFKRVWKQNPSGDFQHVG